MQSENTIANEPSPFFRPYMFLVGLLGWILVGWLVIDAVWSGVPVRLVVDVLLFLALAVVVGLQPVRLSRGAVTTVGFAVDFSCLVIFGAGLAGLIGILSESILLWRSPPLKKLFNQGQVGLAFGGGGLVYRWLGGEHVWRQLGIGWEVGPVAFGRHWLALVGAGMAYFTISSVLIAIVISLRERQPVGGVGGMSFRWMAPRFLALAPFGLLMALVYQIPGLGMIAVGLFLLPLVGARYAFQGAMEMLEVHRETVWALSNALEAYDPYTRNHSELVTRYALAMGKELGMDGSRLEILEWASRLHDIGKCRQDWESIIRKPGKPSAGEWEVIRQHPVEGSRLAEKMEFVPHTAGEVARIVRAHHERLDGSGYPDGKKEDSIGLEARVLGVADAFEAMTARRAYKRRMSVEEAIEELRRCVGKQFDGEVVEALARLWETGELHVEPSLEQEVFSESVVGGVV